MHDILRSRPLADPVDALLADVAVKIQLSRSQYADAEQRYQTIRHWIERDGSPLKHRITAYYPQGSMAIGTTIVSKDSDDRFDLDLMVELHQPYASPRQLLDTLYWTVKGERGSRYYDITHRMTRCVQVRYSDMHLDLTPALYVGPEERTSRIAHSKVETNEHKFVWANPFGFAEWFREQTPRDEALAREFAARAGEVIDIPDHDPVYRKSRPTIALQLIKRWRDLRWRDRKGRQPPSVLLSYYVAHHAGVRPHTCLSLAEELEFQVAKICEVLEDATARKELIDVRNPRCEADKLTDRWPQDISEQMVFWRDLTDFLQDIRTFRGMTTLAQKKQIIQKLFGENIGQLAFDSFVGRMSAQKQAGTLQHVPGAGRIVLATAAASSPSFGAIRTTPQHSFFGGPAPKR